MPSQAQTELFNRIFDGYQTGIDPNEYDAERRDALVERGQSGFWLKNYNDDKLCATAEIYEAGQQIGVIGNTGRSVGPHLHWEVWVNHVPVNPMDWILNQYPIFNPTK